ncbi:hypothetical protein J7M00_00680, partial [bacterium]|nr:hypothetical protein [bacterium]
MVRKIFVLFLLVIITGAFSVPIAYQGKLTNATGVGINDTVDIAILIYDAPTLGTLIDADTSTSVIVFHGLFSTIFDLNIPAASITGALYAEIQIYDGSVWRVLSPRQKVTSTFTAMWSQKSDWAANAHHADYADSTVVIVSTTYADSAKYAIYADTAYYTAFADSARVSDTAHFADEAGFTVNADTANYTTFADSTRIAAFADSARISAFADSAGAVTWDKISNYLMAVNDTAFHKITVSDTFKCLTFITDTLLSFYKINSDGQTGVYIEQFGHPSLPLFFAIYDSATTRGIIYAAGDTIAIIDPVQTADGYAILFNSDTALTINVINDSLSIGVLVNSDTVFYLDYDSLMVDLLGTDDIWGALSDTFDNYSDSLMNEFSDSLNSFRSELSDTLSSRFIGGTGTIPSGSPSVVINEPNVTSTSIIMITLDCTGGTNAGFNVPVAILNITDG